MTPADFHVPPSPEAVAALVDSHGRHAAVERWGWLDDSTLCALTREGRRRTGRARPAGGISGANLNYLVSVAWDGPEATSLRLTPTAAAAALGLSVASLSMRG